MKPQDLTAYLSSAGFIVKHTWAYVLLTEHIFFKTYKRT